MRATLLAGCALLLPCSTSCATINVSPDGSGDYPTIQAAIDAASSGDEIVLADGTFTGDGNWDVDFGTKELVLRSVNGYEATSISGGFDCYTIELHRGIALHGGQTQATRIEGLTIEAFAWAGDGGAIWCVGASPVILECRFRLGHGVSQSRGLNIFVEAGAPLIQDCVFGGNSCDYAPEGWEGVEIYSRRSFVTIERCSFASILANYYGAALNLDGGTISDCTFSHVGGAYQYPGAVVFITGNSSVLNCLFRQNFATCVRAGSGVVIGNCVFEENTAEYGTGVTGGSGMTIRNCTFRRNFALRAGSAIFGSSVSLDHCVFLDNSIGDGPGGTVDCGHVDASHCTFVGNGTHGGARGPAFEIESGTIDHTIIAFGGQPHRPGDEVVCTGTGDVAVTCTDIYANAGGDWTGCIAAMAGTNGNISADPLFCDVAAGDLSLRADSPCAPASTGECGLIGAIGPWCGPLAVEQRSWGLIKALYR